MVNEHFSSTFAATSTCRDLTHYSKEGPLT